MGIKKATLNKVAQVTFLFWIIKIGATTLGETGGDFVSHDLKFGYGLSAVIFFSVFIGALAVQVWTKSFHRFLYWFVIVTTTTAGTTLSDFCNYSVGWGYIGGSIILATILIAVLLAWKLTLGSITINNITSAKTEIFYWMTIFAANTLGTALGDWFTDKSGLGYLMSAAVFLGALFLLGMLYFFTKISHITLFWMGITLTRPLGSTLGDFLSKPFNHGGLDLNRMHSSIALALFISICILFTSRSGASHSKQHT